MDATDYPSNPPCRDVACNVSTGGCSKHLSISDYIRSKTEIPNRDNPNFKVFAVKSHNAKREVR